MPPLKHRNAALTALGFATVALTASACSGPTCYSACAKLYREECNISAPGQTTAQLTGECVDTCQAALNTPGEVGDYDPFEPTSSTNAITIDTDRQAALWMDCVDQSSCENIKGDQNNDGVTDSKKMCLPHF